MLHPVDYKVADAIRHLGCGVPKLDGWEWRIAPYVHDLPKGKQESLIRQSIQRLEDAGVVKLCAKTGVLLGGQIRPMSDEVLANFDCDGPSIEPVTAQVILLDTVKLAEVRNACGKDLFLEPVIPDLVSA